MSLLLVVAIVGIGVRFRAVSAVRRRQVAGIAASVAITALASLVLIDLPILIGGAPLVPREAIAALALPIPIFLALALWQDRGFRLDRLRRSQMTLLHAREEERQLRRDLHDGLGPTLAAIGLKVDTAASWVDRDPATAEKLLGEVRRDLSAALVETRRLVRGLRPPALDELGLAEAIRQAADELSVGEGQPAIAVTAGDLPTLPAAVEVAAYRIVQESLTNVVRHASAEHVDVRVWVDGDSLRIDVSDDGVGFDMGSRPGVGTEAMRERVEALGGDCRIASAPEAGTRVTVMLPVSPG
ncbi:MAG TPA: sensor histidine kinase [Candidatus Limnocylindria bacterium]|nr:sensor histidine kinase [Candidatus Limnocylindria bacterium]